MNPDIAREIRQRIANQWLFVWKLRPEHVDVEKNYVNRGDVFHATGDLMAAKKRYNSALKHLQKGLNQSMFLFAAT